MKIQTNPFLRQSASLLITSFVLMGVLAFTIGGYLYYVEQQASLGNRAQTWNAAMVVAEAGIEEGLQALNSGMSTASGGWSQSGSVYTLTRNMGSGSIYTITNDLTTSTAPIITAKGSVQTFTLSKNNPPGFLAQVGVNVTSASATNISRTIRVRTYKGSSFLASMVAKHKIDMNGNGVLADSYDSSDPAKSTNGVYIASKAQDNGDVASNDGIVNAISAGNANIYGHVSTGPGGSVAIGSSGKIGTHAWQSVWFHLGAQDGYVLDNANFTFPDVSLPYSSGLDPGPGDVVTMSGTATNSINIVNTNVAPGTPPSGQWYGPISIHTNSATSTTYPGAQVNLVTNTTYVTVSSYPGNQPELSTNCVSFTTVTSYPGARRCMTTNCGTQFFSGNPPANACSVGIQGNQGSQSYKWTLPASYTYANVLSYTYAVYTYDYTTYTYDYVVYLSVPTYATNHYDHVIASGNYYLNSTFTGTTYVSGTATLVLPTGLSQSGGDTMIIANGAALTIYTGDDTTLSGQAIYNVAGRPSSLIVYSTGDDFTLNGNGTFAGVLVAPYANVRLNGGGHGDEDFSGALMANNITMNGHFNFHYDEALGRMNGTGRYLIQSWDEL